MLIFQIFNDDVLNAHLHHVIYRYIFMQMDMDVLYPAQPRLKNIEKVPILLSKTTEDNHPSEMVICKIVMFRKNVVKNTSIFYVEIRQIRITPMS